MPLDPETKKFVEERARKFKYDPDKDPVIIDFRKKMKAVRYESVDNTSWVEVLAMIIFIVVLILASR